MPPTHDTHLSERLLIVRLADGVPVESRPLLDGEVEVASVERAVGGRRLDRAEPLQLLQRVLLARHGEVQRRVAEVVARARVAAGVQHHGDELVVAVAGDQQHGAHAEHVLLVHVDAGRQQQLDDVQVARACNGDERCGRGSEPRGSATLVYAILYAEGALTRMEPYLVSRTLYNEGAFTRMEPYFILRILYTEGALTRMKPYFVLRILYTESALKRMEPYFVLRILYTEGALTRMEPYFVLRILYTEGALTRMEPYFVLRILYTEGALTRMEPFFVLRK